MAATSSVRPHALHVISDTDRRGAQVFAVQLNEELRRHGWSGDVVALRSGSLGAQVDASVLKPTRRSSSLARILLDLRRAVLSADVVVAHGSTTLQGCAAAGLGTRVPAVYRSIGDPSYWLNTGYRRTSARLLYRRFDVVVALWPDAREFLVDRIGVAAGRVQVIPNGVRLEGLRRPTRDERNQARFHLGLPVDAEVLVYAGSLSEEKRPDLAIQALATLPPSVWLVVMGDGVLRRELECTAERVAGGRVVFTGQVTDIRAGLWSADAILLTSATEGLPGVLIEAGLCGLPAVATAAGGIPDVVRDGDTGVTVSTSDPAALGAAVRTVLDEGASMGERAHKWCRERYGMPEVAASWDRLLRSRL